MNYLGDFVGDETVPIFFDTVNHAGASVTLTGLAVTDIEIYKDGSVTQRASDAGYTLLDTDGIDFDATTGIHGFSIDLADNTDAGFFAAGSDYVVVVSAVTVESQTINFIAASFSIQNRNGGGASAASVADAVWDEARASHVGAGSFGEGVLVEDLNTAAKASVNAEADTALTDYDAPTSAELVTEIDSVQTDIAALNDLSAAQVNAEVVDVLTIDTHVQPGQGVPPATASFLQMIQHLYKAWRNRMTSTETTISFYNDDASTVDHKQTHSDDATTYDRGEMTTGP